MIHDPLCPCESHKQPHIRHLNGVCHYCQCDLIAKVRDDERVAAAKRVLSVSPEAWKYIETEDRYKELVSVDETYASVLAGAPDPLLEQL